MKKKAFTLIGLLVVIAVIAVLMGILMPALGRVRKQARAVACQANLKHWGLIFKMYTDDNDGKFYSAWSSNQQFDTQRYLQVKWPEWMAGMPE